MQSDPQDRDPIEERENEQQAMLDNMFRNRTAPITVADTMGYIMKGESALFQCFKSPDPLAQVMALSKLVDER